MLLHGDHRCSQLLTQQAKDCSSGQSVMNGTAELPYYQPDSLL